MAMSCLILLYPMMVVCDQVIREIQQNQQSPYNFEEVAIIQKLLESPKLLSTEEAYKKSLGTFSFLLILLMCSSLIILYDANRYCTSRGKGSNSQADQGVQSTLQETC